VCFTIPGAQVAAVSDVSFQIKPGECPAVVRAVPEPAYERIAAAFCAVGVDRSKVGLSRPSSADDPRLRGVVSAADALARPVGAAEVWAHHVAAAALVDELLPALVQGALGVDETQL
jgi:hypothetical protein